MPNFILFKIMIKNILIFLLLGYNNLAHGQNISSLTVIYGNPFEQSQSTIENHLVKNNLAKIIKKVKINDLFVRSKNDADNLFTDSKGKQYYLSGSKKYFCNPCKQIEDLIKENQSNDIRTALYIVDAPSEFELSSCGIANLPENVISMRIRETTDLYNDVYNMVMDKAKKSNKNYSLVIWSPGNVTKGLEFTINNKPQAEVSVNYNEKVTLKMPDANINEKYSLTIDGEEVDYKIANNSLTYSFIIKRNTNICLSNNNCPQVCKSIEVQNACFDCKNDVGLDLDFGDNKYARSSANDKLLKASGIDYEIVQGKQGYKLFYFVVKNQPCVESYELQMSLKYIGDEVDKKKLNGKTKNFPLEISDEETGDKDLITLKANYNELYDDGNGIVDDDMICSMKIVVKKCSEKIVGNPGRSYKVIFQKCN
jgi:hypothetical protein